MSMDRRTFLTAAVGAALGTVVAADSTAKPRLRKPIRAVLFDAFALFDPRVATAVAERVYSQKAAPLMQAWRSRQFDISGCTRSVAATSIFFRRRMTV